MTFTPLTSTSLLRQESSGFITVWVVIGVVREEEKARENERESLVFSFVLKER
jgi:hypothetical protein